MQSGNQDFGGELQFRSFLMHFYAKFSLEVKQKPEPIREQQHTLC